MAGNGPPPQSRRARRNSDPIPLRVIHAQPVEQPELPDFDVTVTIDDQLITQTFRWPERTRDWWQMWADSALSKDFTSTDWSELLDTARLHAAYWLGDLKVAGELRLRVAKFGATPEDRAKLRIVFAEADKAESGPKTPAQKGARTRRGPLREPKAG